MSRIRSRAKPLPVSIILDSGVSASSKSPLYHQIYLILRDQILSGTYRPGQLLPSELEISETYGVSRITARRAVAELAATNLVERFRGRGTIVRRRPDDQVQRASANSWLQSVSSMGRMSSVKVLELSYGGANDEEAKALKMEVGTEVQRMLRIRSNAAGPFSLLATSIPARLGRNFGIEQLQSTPLLELLSEAGVVPSYAEQTISATLANQTTASQLETEVGAPLIKLQRVVYDDAENPVEWLTALYRPDRFQLHMTLTSDQAISSYGNTVSDGDEFESRAKNRKTQGASPA
jgi:Transcriptional regulators